MKEFVTVALDVMGGDNAPYVTVKGGVDAVNANSDVKVLMAGDETQIHAELSKYTYDKEKAKFTEETEKLTVSTTVPRSESVQRASVLMSNSVMITPSESPGYDAGDSGSPILFTPKNCSFREM